MPPACKRGHEAPSDSSESVVMHFDVAAASPKPGSESQPPEQTSANPEARGSAAGGPPRSSPHRDESSKTKDYCKVRAARHA